MFAGPSMIAGIPPSFRAAVGLVPAFLPRRPGDTCRRRAELSPRITFRATRRQTLACTRDRSTREAGRETFQSGRISTAARSRSV